MRHVLENLTLAFLSYVPGFSRLLRFLGTGGTVSARYCYSVWMRHLVMAARNGLPTRPETVAELGPGDSMGIGIAALLSGSDHYCAFDVVEYAAASKNIGIFHKLVELFRRRAPIPDRDELPEVKPYLDSYTFPEHVLDEERLDAALRPERLKAIEEALRILGPDPTGTVSVRYVVPWDNPEIIREGSIDMIFSQAVLEHVDDLEECYRAMHRWLRPDGAMSHTIDFKCHGTARKWDGHRACSDFFWKIMRGRKPYLINRRPHSEHLELMKKLDFEIACDLPIRRQPSVPREALAPAFKNLSEDDRTTSGAFIQAVKKER